MKTTLSDGTRVEYLRDVTGRILQRTETPARRNPAVTVVRYGFSGGTIDNRSLEANPKQPKAVVNHVNQIGQDTIRMSTEVQ